MAFSVEYARSEEEQSEFLRAAMQKLRIGFTGYDMWTVDRDRNLVLRKVGTLAEDQDEEYWRFLDGERGDHQFTTHVDSKNELANGCIEIVRTITYVISEQSSQPSVETEREIKKALETFKDYGLASRYRSCRLKLVTATGREV